MAEVVTNHIRTHVQRLGTGERTVVFLHGIVVDNLASLYFTLAHSIAPMVRVLLYDLRGHGKTQRTSAGYDLNTLLDDLEDLLDAEGLDSSIMLLGHSFGGLLALSFAIRRPKRVGGLMLIDPPLPLEGWGNKVAGIFSIQGEERDRKIAEAYDRMHGSAHTRKRRRLADTANALVQHTTLLADLRASCGYTHEQLACIRCPVLAIYGEGSQIIACAEQLRKLLPKSEVHILPDCTHLVLFEATSQVRRIVTDWIKRRG